MYLWNDIRINLHGDNKAFIETVARYINAVSTEDEAKSDIDVLITSEYKNFTSPGPSAGLLKSLEYEEPEGIYLDIYSTDREIWYIYRDLASIYINFEENRMVTAVKGLPLEFEYYNILMFLFQPVGGLLENFGYFRLHSSSGSINKKALLVTGLSGSGKSTSAFSIPLNGGTIIADDLTYIKGGDGIYTAHSLTALVKLRKDSIERFYPELHSVKAFAEYNDELYYRTEDVNPHKPEPSHITCIAALNKTGIKETSYTLVRPSVIVPHLFPHTISISIPGNTRRKFMFITGMLDEIDCYKIEIGTDLKAYYKEIQNILEAD